MPKQQARHEDRDPRILPKEVGLNVVVVVEILLLTDMTDVLLQPTARMSMGAQFVFGTTIGQ